MVALGPSPEREATMQYRKLGASGIDVSAVGFGAWAIGGWMWGGADENDAVAAIHAALDHGINLVDTAPIYGYGRSEEIVGRAIRDRRQQVVLATKCGLIWDREEGEFHFHANQDGITFRASEKKVYKCLRPESIRAELELSLKRLGVGHVDLYQTHWQEATTPIADTMAMLLKLKDEGKIRAIGVSNANLDQLKAYGPIHSDQEKYSMLDRNLETNGMLDYCRQQNIAVLAYSPLANGLLSGKIRPDRQFGPGDLRRGNRRFAAANVDRINGLLEQLRSMAERHQATIVQLVIAWTCARPGMTCVLCGARNPQQAIENAEAGRIELSADELEMMSKLIQT
jgi:methylglyoxal reductase